MDDHLNSRWAHAPGLLESVWRYKLLVLVVALAGAASGYALAARQAPVYEASARLLLADPRNAGLPGEGMRVIQDAGRYIRNQAEMIRSGAVYPRASELLDHRLDERQIADRVAVEGFNDVDLIVITVTDGSAEGAAELANSVAEAYQLVVGEQVQAQAAAGIQELELRNRAMRDELARLERLDRPGDEASARLEAERRAAIEQIVQNENRIEQIVVDAALFGSGVDVSTAARVPSAPVRPRPVVSAVAGLLLAVAAASALAWWRNASSQSVDRPGVAVQVLEAPLLGEVPDYAKVGYKGSLPTVDAPHSAAAEAYHFVTDALLLAIPPDEPGRGRVVLVTSALPGDGKTVTAANVAVAAARDGSSVVLLDVDQRAYGLTRLVSETADVHFPEVDDALEDGTDWASTPLPFAPGLDLTLVSPGTHVSDPAAYFRGARFRRRLSWVRHRGDLIILDAPPILAVAETAAVASQVDGVLLVVGRGTSVRVLREARRRLELVGANVVGHVYNRALPRQSAQGYVHYGYYSRRQDSPMHSEARPAASNGRAPSDVREPASGGAERAPDTEPEQRMR